MNKSDMAAQVTIRATLSSSQAASAVNAVSGSITDALVGGEPVTITCFGTFSIRFRPVRRGRNPRTGEPIGVAALTAPSSKPGKTVRDHINHARECASSRSP